MAKFAVVLIAACVFVQLAVAISVPPTVTDPDLTYDQQQAYSTWRRWEKSYEKAVRDQRVANTVTPPADPNVVIVTPGPLPAAIAKRFNKVMLSSDVKPRLARLRLHLEEPRHAGYNSAVFDRIPDTREELATMVKALPEAPIKVIHTPHPVPPAPQPEYVAPTGPLTVNATLVPAGTIKAAPLPGPIDVVRVNV